MRHFVLAGLAVLWPSLVFGQPNALMQPRMSSVPATGIPPVVKSSDPVPENETGTSFLDSALPRNTVRTRFDRATYNRTPTMAEYFQPKGGIYPSPGPPLPERNVHYQDFATYAELSTAPWFSIFFETPLRWLNPDLNANERGVGDSNLGFKVVIWQDMPILATLQVRGYLPTAANSALGTKHYSIEPALLLNWRITDYLTLEGDGRFWAPLGGTDFAGNLTRYGLALVYGQRSASEVWMTPVAEVVGWSILGGKVMHAPTLDRVTVEDAAGTFILNACMGARIGLSHNADIYLGYTRCLTGPSWYRDLIRVEFRFMY